MKNRFNPEFFVQPDGKCFVKVNNINGKNNYNYRQSHIQFDPVPVKQIHSQVNKKDR